MKAPISVGAFRKLVKELAAVERRPLAIGGSRELAVVLERELLRGGDPSVVRIGAPEGAAVYVHIGAGEEPLKAAWKARVPIVAVAFDDAELPYVHATDIVRVGPGERLPVERIARAVAARLGEAGAPLAARLPVLRGPVCDRIVESFARKNGIVGAAVFVPGADLPVLSLNQVRMLLLLDQAYGLEPDARDRLPEVIATVGAGFGFRAAARELLDVVPVAGWMRRRRFAPPTRGGWGGFAAAAVVVKGGVAYAGTRALGEAAVRVLDKS